MKPSVSSLSRRVSSELDEISRTVRDLKKRLLSAEKLASVPRNFLWGLFEDFDEATQTLRARIGPDLLFYPLSYYDGEWLPMPGQSVIVTQTVRGAPARASDGLTRKGSAIAIRAPRIVGFTRKGIAIPAAPVVQCKVVEYVPEENFIVGKDAEGQRWTMTLPTGYADFYDSDLMHGQVLAFRVIDVPPRKYFIPLLQPQTSIDVNEDLGEFT